jgi:hypothetical protein
VRVRTSETDGRHDGFQECSWAWREMAWVGLGVPRRTRGSAGRSEASSVVVAMAERCKELRQEIKQISRIDGVRPDGGEREEKRESEDDDG